ncbi:hypothetical protein RDWZM_006288 [Blomia tropicalis]|uniref:Secreted protein n=1 Tax=Blomia tropicalis TaxID=40697 RepID=A0A9Q0RN84_BLOTA|nr:hypothetical protein RDWZM_006288 [Blomia tropicalis]
MLFPMMMLMMMFSLARFFAILDNNNNNSSSSPQHRSIIITARLYSPTTLRHLFECCRHLTEQFTRNVSDLELTCRRTLIYDGIPLTTQHGLYNTTTYTTGRSFSY